MGGERGALEAVKTRLDSAGADAEGELVSAISSFVSALRARPPAEQSRGAEVAGYLTGLLERKHLTPRSRAAALCAAITAQTERLAAGQQLDLAAVRQALAKTRAI